MKPMSAEDAALYMDLLHHDFYVFRNDADGQVNVVYRRRDGDFGLIVPGGLGATIMEVAHTSPRACS